MFIEFFPEGSRDCPLVLLYGREPEVVSRLREQVVALSASLIDRVAVHELSGFESIDGCRLFLSVAGRDIGTHGLKEPLTFDCKLRPITWYNIEYLLEPFTEPSFSDSFQWLDGHGRVQLLISRFRGW